MSENLPIYFLFYCAVTIKSGTSKSKVHITVGTVVDPRPDCPTECSTVYSRVRDRILVMSVPYGKI